MQFYNGRLILRVAQVAGLGKGYRILSLPYFGTVCILHNNYFIHKIRVQRQEAPTGKEDGVIQRWRIKKSRAPQGFGPSAGSDSKAMSSPPPDALLPLPF